MKTVRFIIYYVLGLVGILLISATPALFRGGSFLNGSAYISAIIDLVNILFHPDQWVYYYKGEPYPLLHFLWEPFTYSMTIFFSAITLGCLFACLLAAATFFLPAFFKKMVVRLLSVAEAIPDLLLAFCSQLFVVWLYKQTDILFIQFVTLGQEKIYLLPILVLSVLPALFLYKIILLQLEEEEIKSYVQMARSKGLRKIYILAIHISRNIIKSLFYHTKLIVWSTLSSLIIIEYIFNINGIGTTFMNDFRPIVIALSLFLLFTPFFLIYQGVESFIFKENRVAKETNVTMNAFFGKTSKNSFTQSFKRIFQEVFAHFKNIKFSTGFFTITAILMVSILYSLFAEPLIDQYYQIYDDSGQLVSAAPHSPEYVFLGTDRLGFSIWDQLLAGAKYTILFGILIALLRVAIGFILAIPFAFFCPPALQRVFEKMVDSMHFLPLTIIAYLLLRPVLTMPPGGFQTTETERIVYHAIILTVLSVPLVITLIGNEMKLLMKEEFVLSTKVIGGSYTHLLWSHLIPHLKAKIMIIFGQQFIQTLLILIHLGVLDIFMGGTKVSSSPSMGDPPRTTTYEWSGLIGSSKDALMTGRWWYIIPPLVGFVILIICMQLMIQGIKEVQQTRVGVSVSKSNWLRKYLSPPERARKTRNIKNFKPEHFVFTKSKNL